MSKTLASYCVLFYDTMVHLFLTTEEFEIREKFGLMACDSGMLNVMVSILHVHA